MKKIVAILSFITLFLNSCTVQSNKDEVFVFSDSITVFVDSVSAYKLRLCMEPINEGGKDTIGVTLDREFYCKDKLMTVESRECISVNDADNGRIIDLYKAYYVILSHNPDLSLDCLCIPVTAHGVYYEKKE